MGLSQRQTTGSSRQVSTASTCTSDSITFPAEKDNRWKRLPVRSPHDVTKLWLYPDDGHTAAGIKFIRTLTGRMKKWKITWRAFVRGTRKKPFFLKTILSNVILSVGTWRQTDKRIRVPSHISRAANTEYPEFTAVYLSFNWKFPTRYVGARGFQRISDIL